MTFPAHHKAQLEAANAAIRTGDIDGFLACCTDDLRWTMVGGPTIEGKADVRQWMVEAYKEPPDFTVDQLVGEGDTVTAIGSIITKADDGSPVHHAYCDVWRFRDGRMAELRAFVIEVT